MKFDDLFEYLGDMGLYQWLVFLPLAMISVLGVEAISVNFVAGYMDHWCKVDGLSDYTHDQQKYLAIPVDEENAYSQCDMYAIDYTNYTTEQLLAWNWTTDYPYNNVTTTGCTDWVYDQSEFISTSMSKYDLVCSKQDLLPLISTLFMFGIMIGAFISGPMSDRIGRKPTVLFFLAIKMIFGLMGTFVDSFAAFCVARVFLGMGVYSGYLVANVLVLELVGPRHRAYVTVGFSIAYSIGVMLISGMAYAIRDDTWLQLAYLLPCTMFISYIWLIPESPRWLALRYRYNDAMKVINKMAHVNKKNLPANFHPSQIEREENPNMKHATILDVFRSPTLRKRSIVIDLYWFTVNLIYYALSFNLGALSGSVFVNTVIAGAVEIPANILCVVLCNWPVTGRRLTCCISMLLSGVACFIRIGLILKGLDEADTALSFVGRAFVTVSFSGIYVYAGEVFPTEARNAGMSFAAVFAQISGMISPYVGGPLSRVWEPLPALIFGVLSVASGLSVLLLPETLDVPLFETIVEAENYTGDAGSEDSSGFDNIAADTDTDKSDYIDVTMKPDHNDVSYKSTGQTTPEYHTHL